MCLFGDRLLWKRGVTARGNFADWALQMEQRSEGWWPFAYTILEDIAGSYSDADEPLLQRLYESMRAGNGVYKITRCERFLELDTWLVNRLRCLAQNGRSWFVHDMAASNGITSLELFRSLKSVVDVRLLATDRFTEISIVPVPGSSWRVVFDAVGRPLQFVAPGKVLSAYRREPLRFPINRLWQAWVRRKVLPKAVRMLEQGGAGVFVGASVHRVSLFHPQCLREAHVNRKFELAQHDALEPFCRQADIVRAMNFLTRRHLGLADFRTAANAVACSVVDGGLLIQGRNVDEDNGTLRATVFERQGGRLVPLQDFGGGSEERDEFVDLAFDE